MLLVVDRTLDCLLESCILYSGTVILYSDIIVGPSGVRALPLAAGINVGGHYKWHFFSSLSLLPGSFLILTEGVVVGFCNLALAPK